MTVKEQRAVLFGPADKLSVTVAYESEEYDITEPSPVSEAFANYVVDCVSAHKPFEYCIFLKREYVVEGET